MIYWKSKVFVQYSTGIIIITHILFSMILYMDMHSTVPNTILFFTICHEEYSCRLYMFIDIIIHAHLPFLVLLHSVHDWKSVLCENLVRLKHLYCCQSEIFSLWQGCARLTTSRYIHIYVDCDAGCQGRQQLRDLSWTVVCTLYIYQWNPKILLWYFQLI